MTLQRMKKNILGFLLKNLFFDYITPKNSLTIFMFHRVLPENQWDFYDRHLVITPRHFESVLLFLKQRFSIIDLSQWHRCTEPERYCAITFDDGWVDNKTYALPILRKLDLPATIFLPVNFIDNGAPFWFELLDALIRNNQLKTIIDYFSTKDLISHKEYASKSQLYFDLVEKLKRLPYPEIVQVLKSASHDITESPNISFQRALLTWNDVKEMGDFKISFGSHGMNHAIFPPLSDKDKYEEIAHSRKILENKKINFNNIMSFPNGSYDQRVLDITHEAGYALMVTASINQCGTGYHKKLYNRIGVNHHTSISDLINKMFKARLTRKVAFKNSM